MQANCSWCFENSTHVLERETTKWICQACLGTSERCMASGCTVCILAPSTFSVVTRMMSSGYGALRGHFTRQRLRNVRGLVGQDLANTCERVRAQP
jgi:hypothetical protein